MFKYGIPVTIGLALIILIILNPFVIIGAGERGVVLSFGAVQDTILQEGLSFRIPIVQKIRKMDVQTRKLEYQADAASRDLQEVQIKVALNYHLNPDQVNILWQNIGQDYESRVIQPAIEESIKAASALFNAEQLITERSEVKAKVREILKTRLETSYMTLDDISIVNFQFSQEFDRAIESKVTAEQEALAEKNRLEKVKFQAQQQIENAKAEAEAIRIRSQALNNNAKLVELEAVQRWDGNLPTYMMGDSIPFLNLQ